MTLIIPYLTDHTRRNKPDIIFLTETKNTEAYCETVRRKLKIENGEYVNPNGISGRLALWWTKEVQVVIHTKNEYMMDTTITKASGGGAMHITWIYRSTSWGERL